MGPDVDYTGVYINLDRSTERRAAMEAQFARYGLAQCYRRFSAAAGNILGLPTSLTDGEMGCLTSHYLVCRDHQDCSTHLHVVEDDAVFSRLTSQAIRTVILPSLMERYDLLFLDGVIDPLQAGLPFREYKALYDKCIIRDQHGTVIKVNFRPIAYVATSTSYLVNGRSIKKLLSVYDQVLANGAREPIDIMLRKKGQAGALRVGCLFPFLTSIRLDGTTTTISERGNDDRSVLAINLARHSFFVDRDIAALLAYADKVFSPPADPHSLLLSRLLAFNLSPEFRQF